MREFEDEFAEYIESANPNQRLNADSMAIYRQRMLQSEDNESEDDRRYYPDSNSSNNNHVFSSSSQQNAAHHEGASNQSHGIPIV